MTHPDAEKKETAEYYRRQAAEHREKARAMRRTFLRSGIFASAALIALVIASIAWFVSNEAVSGKTMSVTTANASTFALATRNSDGAGQGVYDDTETGDDESALAQGLNKLFRIDKNGRDDWQGNFYNHFQDLPQLTTGTDTWTDTDGTEYILGDQNGISLMITSTENVNNSTEMDQVIPGSKGSITFYLIPFEDTVDEIDVTVCLTPYTLETVSKGTNHTATAKAVTVQDADTSTVSATMKTALVQDISGHILMFLDSDHTSRVIPEITSDGEITYTFTVSDGLTKNTPHAVTVYWMWPTFITDYLYPGETTSVYASAGDAQNALISWVNSNKKLLGAGEELCDLSTDMTNDEQQEWSTAYNRADQIIGNYIAYFLWTIDATD